MGRKALKKLLTENIDLAKENFSITFDLNTAGTDTSTLYELTGSQEGIAILAIMLHTQNFLAKYITSQGALIDNIQGSTTLERLRHSAEGQEILSKYFSINTADFASVETYKAQSRLAVSSDIIQNIINDNKNFISRWLNRAPELCLIAVEREGQTVTPLAKALQCGNEALVVQMVMKLQETESAEQAADIIQSARSTQAKCWEKFEKTYEAVFKELLQQIVRYDEITRQTTTSHSYLTPRPEILSSISQAFGHTFKNALTESIQKSIRAICHQLSEEKHTVIFLYAIKTALNVCPKNLSDEVFKCWHNQVIAPLQKKCGQYYEQAYSALQSGKISAELEQVLNFISEIRLQKREQAHSNLTVTTTVSYFYGAAERHQKISTVLEYLIQVHEEYHEQAVWSLQERNQPKPTLSPPASPVLFCTI